MRSFLAILAFLLGCALPFAPLISAQDDIDIPAIAEAVLAQDPDSLVLSLHTPMTNEALPEGFSNAKFLDPDVATTDEGAIVQGDADDIVATVSYSLTYEPVARESASPTPMASPQVRGPSRIYNTASLHFLVYERGLDIAGMEGFDATLLETLGNQAANADVMEIVIDDITVYVASATTIANGIEVVMQWVAIPVGNVAVVSMVMSGGVSVDIEELRSHSESLAMAGIRHLQVATEDPSKPAG